MTALLLEAVRVGNDGPADLRIRDGRIAETGHGLEPAPGAERIDASGLLALPGLVDAHAHLDKTLWGTPWHPHRAGPSVLERIENERAVLAALDLSPERQATRLVRHMVARGTTHVRTHVDVGPDIGLRHFRAMRALRESHREWMDVQIVAFPQTGVMRAPGTLDLLEQAVREGAEVVGGLDPIGVDRDPKGQLDGIFGIADRHAVEVDVHLHDRGDLGAVTIEMIAERTGALGLRGRVAISHAFCLGSVDAATRDRLVDLLLAHDIAIMTHAPGGQTPFPPVRLLHERGVRLFTGSDGVRDTWGPLNSGDMLERAFLLAYLNGFRDDPGIELALAMATTGGARVMGAGDHGLAPGCAADLVLLEAETPAEAVAARPPRRLVIKRGKVVARDGRALLPEAD